MHDFLTLSRAEVRAIDAAAIQELNIPSMLLMENAARGVVDVLQSLDYDRCLILCGRGNNGGDGLAIARLLSAKQKSSDVFLLSGSGCLATDTARNLQILQQCNISVHELSPAFISSPLDNRTVVVDCLLGTGFRGDLRPKLRTILSHINQQSSTVVSVDVPSGLDCQTGQASPDCLIADITVTFVGKKQGFESAGAAKFLGEVIVKPIGIPDQWVRNWLRDQRLKTSAFEFGDRSQ